ncbi:hypothetical protein [Capybara microvirus Cap1_SP_22]|nr:hypothetical protein [Capybara microvirus Cap1_SP_22]
MTNKQKFNGVNSFVVKLSDVPPFSSPTMLYCLDDDNKVRLKVVDKCLNLGPVSNYDLQTLIDNGVNISSMHYEPNDDRLLGVERLNTFNPPADNDSNPN